jgi:hypothetical protein
METVWIRDGKKSDPGPGINIQDPQRCWDPKKNLFAAHSAHPSSAFLPVWNLYSTRVCMCSRHMDRLLFSFSVFKWTNTYALSFISSFARILWVGADGGQLIYEAGKPSGAWFCVWPAFGLSLWFAPPPRLMISWTSLLPRLWLT